MDFTSQDLSAVAGIIISLVLTYVPKVKTWYNGLTGDEKRLVLLVILAIVSVGIFGLSCAGWGEDIGIVVECSAQGAFGLLKIFFEAVIASQVTYWAAPRTLRVFRWRRNR